jgi:hypothetical protein
MLDWLDVANSFGQPCSEAKSGKPLPRGIGNQWHVLSPLGQAGDEVLSACVALCGII